VFEEEGEKIVAVVLENEKICSNGVGRRLFFFIVGMLINFLEDGK